MTPHTAHNYTQADLYAHYLWTHAPTTVRWANNLQVIDSETLAFEPLGRPGQLHFFTAYDLFTGAQRAARYLMESPTSSAIDKAEASAVLNQSWQIAPKHREFIDLAAQLSVFPTVRYQPPKAQSSNTRLSA